MKILFTTQNMLERAGSKTYAVTVGRAMVSMGHEVTFVTRDNPDGPMGLLAAEVGEVILYGALPDRHYDIAFISPHCCDEPEIRACSRKIVSISHGRVDAEKPIEDADSIVFVSEEVQDYWTEKLGLGPSMVVRNPIDRDFWDCPDVNATLTSVAFVSNYEEIPWLEGAVLGWGLDFLRLKHKHPEVVKFSIDQSQLIIATGRSCYEAMSCGREVLILDNRPYNADMIGYAIAGDGLASDVYMGARRSNCSGRHSNYTKANYTKEFTSALLHGYLRELSSVDPSYLRKRGRINRNYIRMYQDAHMIAKELLTVRG